MKAKTAGLQDARTPDSKLLRKGGSRRETESRTPKSPEARPLRVRRGTEVPVSPAVRISGFSSMLLNTLRQEIGANSNKVHINSSKDRKTWAPNTKLPRASEYCLSPSLQSTLLKTVAKRTFGVGICHEAEEISSPESPLSHTGC